MFMFGTLKEKIKKSYCVLLKYAKLLYYSGVDLFHGLMKYSGVNVINRLVVLYQSIW